MKDIKKVAKEMSRATKIPCATMTFHVTERESLRSNTALWQHLLHIEMSQRWASTATRN